MQTAFGADLSRFRAMTMDRLRRVMIASVIEVVANMQVKARGVSAGGVLKTGFMPYNSTALYRSLTFIIGSSRTEGPQSYKSMSSYQVGEGIEFFWNQPYSGYIERGDEKFPGWRYFETNAAQWDDIVKSNARRIRNRRS